ncbi:MAG: TIGR03960 family B12-binding radical SAM protein, partial [Deltaproteobacteria bacterium]|nr:TIGR03960 family B12-binding radical SAM protein [Deltaproteobacteria bacterium]
VYLPWVDMDQLMREAKLPLFSLESKHAIADFQILAVSLPYDTVYSNLLALLDLSKIPLRVEDRDNTHPLVIAGGHATFNPEPTWAFVDAFAIGEGEEVLLEIARATHAWRESGADRATLHRQLARLEGVYVPSLYRVQEHDDGRISHVEAMADAPLPVSKRVVGSLPPPPRNHLVPNLETIHDRATVEIMRGCSRGCRFCHAGFVTRPIRERSVDDIVTAIEHAIECTGFSEVGLLSLSSSDYSDVLELVNRLRERFEEQKLNISLPSLRIDSFSIELMQALAGTSRRGGFTLAPEAASERIRKIINKPVSTEQVVRTAREVFEHGWHTIKLYFMIGHPGEELEDVQAIADLCHAVLAEGRAAMGGRAKVNISVGTFVPKPHTPFQWVPCDTPEQIRAKQSLLRQRLRHRAFKLSWSGIEETMLEAQLSRGDRRLADVIETAYALGVRFDAWQEHFRPDLWQQAFAQHGLDPHDYSHRQRELDETLPWDHIDAGVEKKVLAEEYQRGLAGETREDCASECYACGILRRFKPLQQTSSTPWKCPQPNNGLVAPEAQETHS